MTTTALLNAGVGVRVHPGLHDAVQAPPIAPAGQPLVEQLCAVWEQFLGTAPISAQANFFEMGGKPRTAVAMLRRVGELTGRSLPPAALVRAPTPAALARVIEDPSARQPGSSLVELRPGQGRPVFLVHGMGGSVMECWPVLRAMRTTRPIWGLQARGIEGDQQPHRSIDEVAASYAAEIQRLQEDGPYTIIGFSFGGVAGFEMARQLVDAGKQVDRLCMLDPYVHEGINRILLCALRVANAARRLVQKPAGDLPAEVGRKLRAQARDLRTVIVERRPLVPGRHLEMTEVQRRVYEALWQALARYTPAMYPGGPVLIVRSARPLDRYFFAMNAWRRVVPRLQEVSVGGDHMDLIGSRAGLVAAHLDQALRATTPGDDG